MSPCPNGGGGGNWTYEMGPLYPSFLPCASLLHLTFDVFYGSTMKGSLRASALAVLAITVTTTTAQSASPSASATHKQCYLPGGLKSGDIPCDPNAEHSMCCKDANHCLSNGLCLDVDDATPDQGIMYVRGTCTDQNWNSPFCPQHCRYSTTTISHPRSRNPHTPRHPVPHN